MGEPPDPIRDAPAASLAVFATAHRDALEVWAMACMRPIDPRCWGQCTLLCGATPLDTLTLLGPGSRPLGEFALVESGGQFYFRSRIFDYPPTEPPP